MTKLYQREGAYIPRVAAVHDLSLIHISEPTRRS